MGTRKLSLSDEAMDRLPAHLAEVLRADAASSSRPGPGTRRPGTRVLFHMGRGEIQHALHGPTNLLAAHGDRLTHS